MSDAKRQIQVPYAEKDAAKSLGARWDTASKRWYIPDGVQADNFKKWWVAGVSYLSAEENEARMRMLVDASWNGGGVVYDAPPF